MKVQHFWVDPQKTNYTRFYLQSYLFPLESLSTVSSVTDLDSAASKDALLLNVPVINQLGQADEGISREISDSQHSLSSERETIELVPETTKKLHTVDNGILREIIEPTNQRSLVSEGEATKEKSNLENQEEYAKDDSLKKQKENFIQSFTLPTE
ncbi:uncharacterized protein LOC116417885 [Nasonia vitripennis]|uniref:Uncharacterized protein n=1 Tax=Nasonia vitripennis TaxID=7425 RepID=A0A7M7TB93_NASVI|nr:uncharacterized protein LOC116417885 [Nasonia vitripennis]